MRAVVVSHRYADPANRAKLKALAGLGVDVTAIVPERWVSKEGIAQTSKPGNDGGVQLTTIPVRGIPANPGLLLWNAKALRRQLTDLKPNLVHIEEEPWTQAAVLGLRLARRLGVPGVLATTESLPRSYSIAQRAAAGTEPEARGRVGGSNSLALALAVKRRPALAHTVIPAVRHHSAGQPPP